MGTETSTDGEERPEDGEGESAPFSAFTMLMHTALLFAGLQSGSKVL